MSAFTVAADLLDGTRAAYRPRGGCAAIYHDDTSAEVVVSGPAGTGKSRACLERLHRLARQSPGMRGLIVRKTFNSLSWSALVTWETHVVAEALAEGEVTFFGGSTREPPCYRYRNGSRVVIGGMDKASRHMSSEYDVIFVQEAIELTEADWEALSTRLRNGVTRCQQLMADTNPDVPTHWLKRRCDEHKTRMVESRHEDNPVYFDDAGQPTEAGRVYIARLDALTGVRLHRLRHGRWVAAEGVIYEGFDPVVHLVDRFPIPEDWVRWWSVDFGYRNPFVLQRWAEDPDGRLFLYGEQYMTGRLVEDHARDVLAEVTAWVGDDRRPEDMVSAKAIRAAVTAGRREWVEPKPRAIVCDHDAEDRATLERHLGMSTTKADKRVKAGIEAVQARLRPDGSGRPALVFLRDSLAESDPALDEAKLPRCTVEEVPGYIWAPAPDGKPQKEEPLKRDDHGCDGARYVVAHRDLGSRSRFRGWA